ncbi:MAG: gephyrin-like molybdotransferase Glp, partial [Candidatus Limnocylindrales bacterium]
MKVDADTAGGLLSVEETLERILAAVPGALPSEDVAVEAGMGRVLAVAVTSATDLPPWDNSAMDGYAVRAADLAGADEGRPVRLTVTGDVRAGQAPDMSVEPGTAVRIATGAPLPAGADAVVQVELTTPLDGTGTAGPRGRDATGPLPAACLVHRAVEPGMSIRSRGEDVRAGEVVLQPGIVLRPADIAAAAAVGTARLIVHRRPRVAVLA